MKYKNYFVTTFFILILVLFQTSFFAEIFGEPLNPNLIIALVFSLLFINRASEAFFSAFVGGLLLDTLGNSILGLSSLVLVLAILLTLLAKKLVQKSGLTQAIILFITFVVYTVIENYPNNTITPQLLLGGLITLLSAYSFYLIIKSMSNEHKYL